MCVKLKTYGNMYCPFCNAYVSDEEFEQHIGSEEHKTKEGNYHGWIEALSRKKENESVGIVTVPENSYHIDGQWIHRDALIELGFRVPNISGGEDINE